MKKNFILSSALFILSLISCQKNNSGESITLKATTTNATVGQAVGLQVTTRANAVNWSVTPSVNASKLYTITNQKSNVITFAQSGQYVVGVSARDVDIDSTFNKNADSCWHSHDREHGRCQKDVDSASVTIIVK